MLLSARENRGWVGCASLFFILFGTLFAHIAYSIYGHILRRNTEKISPFLPCDCAVGKSVSVEMAYLVLSLSALGFLLCGWFAQNMTCFVVTVLTLGYTLFVQNIYGKNDYSVFYHGGTYLFLILSVWVLSTGHIHWIPILLGLLIGTWKSGMFALESIRTYSFDLAQKKRSLAIYWGEKNALSYAFLVHLSAVLGLAVLGFLAQLKIAYMFAISFIMLFVLMEHWIARIRKKHWLGNAFYKLDAIVALVFLAGVTCEVVFSYFTRIQ